MTAIEAAITRSISHTEIVAVPWTEATEAELLARADLEDFARVPNSPIGDMDPWGTLDGPEWRIKLEPSRSEWAGPRGFADPGRLPQ